MGIDGNSGRNEANESVLDRNDNDVGSGSGVGFVDDTDPDLLKNTPSNIQRLEDEIEQFEGRQKYLAQTRSPSDSGDVRWYFCKVPLGINELAASVPHSEVVGKGEYFRFGMRDSLAIEASFLQREEELLSYWWKEYAECSDGPKERNSSTATSDLQKNPQVSELYAVEEERVGVPVKGGLYEVDLMRRHSFPVYWNGENRRVLRGHWFAQSGGLDWFPLREDVAEQLEFAYGRQVWRRRTFQPSGLFAARVDLQGPSPGLHALFTGEDNTWEAWLNVDASGFSSVVNFGGNGIKLRRGYAPSASPKPTQDELRQQKEEERDDYCSQVPVRHLVFMVHGIGQRLEKSNLVDDVIDFLHVTSSLAETHLTSYQRGKQRVLFIPCQWRKGLKLSGESTVDKCTLDGVRGLRTTLSATVHDVLYYMSPIYCQDIINSVSNQLNRLYLKFMKRNPGYDGKVSLYGHSLGSVLSYDILCHQENLSCPFPMDWMYSKHEKEDECNFKADETEALQEALDDDELEKEQLPYLENEEIKDPLPIPDACPTTSSSVREESCVEERDGEMQASTLPSFGDDLGVTDPEKMDCLEDKISLDSVVPPDITENEPGDMDSSDTVDKDEIITELKSEVDFLRARVAELEAQVGRHDTSASHEEHQGISNKEESVKNPVEADDSSKRLKPLIKYTKLEFKVDTFFAVGSPLGVFLSLRNVRIGIGEGRDYWGEENIIEEIPSCRRMFNIFHPCDPVAYRVEPLVCKEYLSKRPVIIPYHRGGKRLHIGLQEFAEDFAARSRSVMNHLNSAKVKVITVCHSRKEGLEETTEDVIEEVRSYGSFMMERLTGSEEGRIDHVLQDKTFQHAYISVLGAHTNYWRDHDTGLFILKHLYRDIPEEPLRSSKDDDNSTTGLSTIPEEELPLTFSENSLIGNFSNKSKKYMKR